jgi:hypothetical protein
VRAEDKQLESADLDHEEARARDLVAEDELQEIAGEEVVDVEPVHDRDLERQRVVLGTIRAIFDKKNVTISLLGLPDHEARALEALHAAVSGRGGLGTFVYADDRRDLLEKALAVLQPNLTQADPQLMAELGSLDKLTEKLGRLREKLNRLGDAQEVLNEWDKREWFGEVPETDDDKPKPEADADADIEVGTTLTGPERAEEPKPKSTLDGPGPGVETTRPKSTIYEPDA